MVIVGPYYVRIRLTWTHARRFVRTSRCPSDSIVDWQPQSIIPGRGRALSSVFIPCFHPVDCTGQFTG